MGKPLDQLQREFVDALLRAGAEKRLSASLAGDEEKKSGRIALYRGNRTQTWHNVLAGAYPVLRALVGDTFFMSLTYEYGMADPASSGDLNQFGHRMAELLAAWPQSAPYRHLADIARLEWLVHRAYFAANAIPWSPEKWAEFAEELENSTIRIHPAVELLQTSTSVADLWLAHSDNAEDMEPHDVDRPQWMAVTRPRWIPHVIVLTPESFAMLEALKSGVTLGAALDAAFEANDDFDFPTVWRMWIEHGVVVSTSGQAKFKRENGSISRH
jgi:Putative DNA-binding domain